MLTWQMKLSDQIRELRNLTQHTHGTETVYQQGRLQEAENIVKAMEMRIGTMRAIIEEAKLKDQHKRIYADEHTGNNRSE